MGVATYKVQRLLRNARASLEEEVAKLREQTGESAREGKERARPLIARISAQLKERVKG